jgi:hypothetical protein
MLFIGMNLCFVALCVSLWLGNRLSFRAYKKLQVTDPEWALFARIAIFLGIVLLVPGLMLLLIITLGFMV